MADVVALPNVYVMPDTNFSAMLLAPAVEVPIFSVIAEL
jgi:hypothetical protein